VWSGALHVVGVCHVLRADSEGSFATASYLHLDARRIVTVQAVHRVRGCNEVCEVSAMDEVMTKRMATRKTERRAQANTKHGRMLLTRRTMRAPRNLPWPLFFLHRANIACVWRCVLCA
jgi:hypothetical protein